MSEQAIISILTSAVVPILVALISSGKLASLLTRKMGLEDLTEKVDKLTYKVDENQALTYRTRILRFNGEIKRGVKHDEEEFNDILEAIDGYELFCKEHPNFPNSKSVLAVENVKRTYQETYSCNNF